MSGTFVSLRTRNYRLFFVGQLISVSGNWMQTVAMSFLTLELTGSGTALGLATAARFAPILLFGPWGGLVADRMDKRRILYVTQALSALIALAYGVLISVDMITMTIVYVLAVVLGFVNVFDNPARQSFIPELVAPELLSNAVTLNSVTVNVARIVGAAAGGSIAAGLGLSVCFDVDAASFLAVLITLALMTGDTIVAPERVQRERGQIRAGLRYAGTTPELLVPLLMIAVVGTFAWEFQVSLPLLARLTFHQGAQMYGLMTAAMGVGAVVGGLVAASRTLRRGTELSVAAVGWGIAIILAALAPTPLVVYLVMLPVGYGSITFNSMAKTYLQLASAPSMRGRVMALWALAWLGSTPIGGPIIGLIGQHGGGRWAVLAGGLPTVLVGVLAYPTLRAIDRRRVIVAEPVMLP